MTAKWLREEQFLANYEASNAGDDAFIEMMEKLHGN
jgi:hypothetical protein